MLIQSKWNKSSTVTKVRYKMTSFVFVLTIFATVVNAISVTIGSTTYPSQRALIDSGKRCGTKEPTPAQMAETTKVVNEWLQVNDGGTLSRSSQRINTTTKTVNTYFHVITAGSNGTISARKLQAQYTIFKNEFAKHGFNFVLRDTTYSNNRTWYYSEISSAEVAQMRQKLKIGGLNTLNVYFNYCEGNLGYSSFPVGIADYPIDDGVCIYSESVPGGRATGYDQGKMLIHEVGHWLGLAHTFPDKSSGTQSQLCNHIGDHIADTPRMASATFGCPWDEILVPITLVKILLTIT